MPFVSMLTHTNLNPDGYGYFIVLRHLLAQVPVEQYEIICCNVLKIPKI